jgi:hypothetical protein
MNYTNQQEWGKAFLTHKKFVTTSSHLIMIWVWLDNMEAATNIEKDK